MNKDGGQFVKTVEDQAVLPDHNCHHKHTHAEHIVGLVPDQTVGKQNSLDQYRGIHEVTEVKHEKMIFGSWVLNISETI